jgi:hypothetical protein
VYFGFGSAEAVPGMAAIVVAARPATINAPKSLPLWVLL